MKYKDLLLFFPSAYLIIIGFVARAVKDKKINSTYGYRSALSMKNKQNWYFANNLMAKGAISLGILFFIIGFFVYKYVDYTTLGLILIVIAEIFAYIVFGIMVEDRLKSAHKR
ncbi:MAG: SdpI family protein [Anaerococcus sp.]|nr:SdpI family protein [Anaerococcus sp.]